MSRRVHDSFEHSDRTILNIEGSRKNRRNIGVRYFGMSRSGGLSLHCCMGASGPALACASLIVLFSFIRRHNWHGKLEVGAFRKMVLPGLIADGLSHRCAEWLRASVSDEQPHGPSPLHGTMSHWPLTLSTFLLPFVYHHLDGLEYLLLMEGCTLTGHKHCTSICAVKWLILRAFCVTGIDLKGISDSAAPERGIPCLLLSELHHIPPGSHSSA